MKEITLEELLIDLEDGLITEVFVYMKQGETHVVGRSTKGMALTVKGFEMVEAVFQGMGGAP